MKKMLLNYLDTRNKKIIAGISVVAVILASTLGIYALTKDNLPDFVLSNSKTIKLEYGDKYSVNGMKLLNTEGMDDKDKKILKNGLSIKSNFKYEDGKDYPAVGEYKITMIFNDDTLVKKVKVADTTAPELNTEFRDIDIVKGTDLNTYDFGGLNLFNATDLSPVEVGYDSSAINSSTVGTYVLKVTAKDTSSNETTKELTVNITETPNENQELVTETVTNADGTKTVKNTVKKKVDSSGDKVVSSGNNSNSSSNNSGSKPSGSTGGSSGSSGSGSNKPSNGGASGGNSSGGNSGNTGGSSGSGSSSGNTGGNSGSTGETTKKYIYVTWSYTYGASTMNDAWCGAENKWTGNIKLPDGATNFSGFNIKYITYEEYKEYMGY